MSMRKSANHCNGPPSLIPSLILGLWWWTDGLHHALDQLETEALARHAHGEGGLSEQGGMAEDGGQDIAVDVAGELELGSVGVTGADVAGLELLELLLGAELVGL